MRSGFDRALMRSRSSYPIGLRAIDYHFRLRLYVCVGEKGLLQMLLIPSIP